MACDEDLPCQVLDWNGDAHFRWHCPAPLRSTEFFLCVAIWANAKPHRQPHVVEPPVSAADDADVAADHSRPVAVPKVRLKSGRSNQETGAVLVKDDATRGGVIQALRTGSYFVPAALELASSVERARQVGGTVYLSYRPSPFGVKMLAQNGIKKIVFVQPKKEISVLEDRSISPVEDGEDVAGDAAAKSGFDPLMQEEPKLLHICRLYGVKIVPYVFHNRKGKLQTVLRILRCLGNLSNCMPTLPPEVDRRHVWYTVLAVIASLSSPDGSRKVGAVLVRRDEVIGIGYNTMMMGPNFWEVAWRKNSPVVQKDDMELHAEQNAIVYAFEPLDLIHGEKCIYTTHRPCAGQCAPLLEARGFGKQYFWYNYVGGSEPILKEDCRYSTRCLFSKESSQPSLRLLLSLPKESPENLPVRQVLINLEHLIEELKWCYAHSVGPRGSLPGAKKRHRLHEGRCAICASDPLLRDPE